MSDVVTGLRQVIQDLVAPELKAHTVKLEALQKTVDTKVDDLHKTVDVKIDGLQQTVDTKIEALQKTVDMHHESEVKTAELRHEAVMRTLDSFRSEFAALRAINELEVLRQVSPISERIAIVEPRVKQG